MTISPNNLEIFFECEEFAGPNPFQLEFINFPMNTWFYKESNIVITNGLISQLDIDFKQVLSAGYKEVESPLDLGEHNNRPLNYEPTTEECMNKTQGINPGNPIILTVNIKVNGVTQPPTTAKPNPIKKPYDNATHKGG